MIKILLTSDIHLGIKSDNPPIPEEERINSFNRITKFAKEHDLLLIAGDLFDNTNIDDNILDLVSKEFMYLRENNVEIICIPGENELNSYGSIPDFFLNLNLSHLFSDLDYSPFTYEKNQQKIFIYGLPASKKIDISKIKRVSEKDFHIGMFHANFIFQDYNDIKNIYKFTSQDVKSLNLDFYALGHHHQFKLYKSHDQIIGAYPGSSEATSYEENGNRYALSVIISNNEIKQIKGLIVNSVIIKETIIDCNKYKDPNEIYKILEDNKSSNMIIKIILKGKRNFKFDYNIIDEYKKKYLNLVFSDKSQPSIDFLIEEYQNENSLRGEFFNLLQEKIANDEIPKQIDIDKLSEILNQSAKNGLYSPEDWLCK